MALLKGKNLRAAGEPAAGFMRRVLKGLQNALSYDAPVIIVTHGVVYRVLSLVLDIADYPSRIDNCIPVHFYLENDPWRANKIINI